MFFRYFLTLCIIALFSVAVRVSADEEQNVEERANPAVSIVIQIIEKLFIGAAKSCLGEAANQCKDQWRHPTQALQCAKNFLGSNKGRCAVGK